MAFKQFWAAHHLIAWPKSANCYRLLLFILISLLIWSNSINRYTVIQPKTIRSSSHNVQEVKSHSKATTIAFVTYELFPVSPSGGAGVVINGVVVELLQNGYNVVVIADISTEQETDWIQYHKRYNYTGTLYLFRLQALKVQPLTTKYTSIFMKKTLEFAGGARKVYSIIPFDMIETFDYAGVAYELLRNKRLYLPDHVLIAIRLHGTLQMIDQHEKLEEPMSKKSERSLVYLQEQYAMSAADLRLIQTHFQLEQISKMYNIPKSQFTYAPAPLKAITKCVHEARAAVPVTKPPDGKFVFLVYGRVQLVKGLVTVIKAMIQVLEENSEAEIYLVFLGPETLLAEKGPPTSSYLRSLVPEKWRKRIMFQLMSANRNQLVEYVQRSYAAIFASEFETLNVALHEVASLRIPLILSSIPPFVEYFGQSEQAVFFETGNPESLAKALLYMTSPNGTEHANYVRNQMMPKQYDPALTPYSRDSWPVTGLNQNASWLREQAEFIETFA